MNKRTAKLSQTDLENNCHPHLHALRATEPVAWVPVFHGWLVTRYDLAIQVMRDATTFTVDHPGFSTAQVVGPSMLSLDGPAHLHHRTPFDPPFRRRPVEARFTESITAHLNGLIDRFIHEGQVELCRAYAAPIAVQTMVDALGLRETPIDQILGWYDAIVAAVEQVTLGKAVSGAGQAAFAALHDHLLPALRQSPDTSLLAAASGMAQGLRDEQIIANAAILLFGGIETTEGMIANALYFLLTNPAVWGEARANPALVPVVIEETLRLEPAAAVVDRYATTDVQLAGTTIQAGALVRVSLSGANRDPAVFPDPDRFDSTRPNLRTHVAFAQGPHVCLGLHLARLETQLALTQLLTRLPNLRLTPGAAALRAAQPRGLVFRKPTALAVEWNGANAAGQ